MNINRQTTRPLDFPRTIRLDGWRGLTSMPAGKVVPLAVAPLLREDAVSGRYRCTFEMQETAELLMNAVYVDVKAWLVPWLALARFGGSMDILNRSYNGKPPMEGESVIPFVQTAAKGAHGAEAIYKYLGLHAKAGANVNTMIAEAYNAIWNYRAKNRSPDITERALTDVTLAPAFWRHENFAHIVPSFDQAVMDGEVALNIASSGITLSGTPTVTSSGPLKLKEGSRETVFRSTTSGSGLPGGSAATVAPLNNVTTGAMAASSTFDWQYGGGLAVSLAAITAEMAENGVTVSLANLEQAKKVQAFARLREQFSEHDEDWIIDMLMSGLTIPDEALKRPMLLAERANVFGQSKRYSTDADALSASATNGFSQVDLNIRVPRLATGGVIMVTAEVTPEQLFERKKNAFFHLGSVEELPDALRDTLDTQKVDVVTNDYVDVDHDDATDTFGYAPLNHVWTGVSYNIGGKFYRPAVDASFDEDRQRLWAVETEDPVLSQDFYLCTTMHQKPFLDATADPFEAVTIGELRIEGNTVFGGVLVEALDNYAAVMAKAPTDQIDQNAP